MRRRFLGPKHSKNGTSSSAHNKRLIPPSAVTSPVDHSSNRRSFVGGGSAAANTDESNCALMAENKYATIGRFAKKWPWECYRPSPPAAVPPLPVDEKKCRLSQRGGEDGDSEALNGDGQRRRPRSMARAMEEAGDGIALLSITGAVPADHHHPPMSESSAHSPPEGAPPMAPGVLFQPTSVAGGNNRNSTGSTNSSQASSGFESAKSSSSHHLATSISSGSCSSGVGSSSATVVLPHSSVLPPNASPEGPASASSRLSSAGSSTQCRSSAYFSISDGFDSSIGPGGTLTVHKISKGKCPRVNITEMIARGIPEAEIFTEWLQRLCLSEYLALFLGQGYDLTTLARASPEDLTTLGITKPEDRKRLFHDIQTWRNLQDNWPKNLAFDANLSDWLNAIGLKQYVELFEQQGYLSVGSVEQLEPEDLEDIGVKKLGHIKRICLALKKLRSCRADSADMPLSVCPLLCPPSSSSSVCPLPSIVALPLDIHSTTFVPSSAAEDPFKQSTNKWQQSQMTQQSNSQPTTARNWDKNCQRISFDGISTDGTRIISKWREDNDKHVQLRNFSFERDSLDEQPTPDRGPPRLNLYRTSQIIAKLPREPPPEFDEADERGLTKSHLAEGHRGPPPPPAPAPFAPFEMLPLALPSSSCSVSSSSSFLRLFSSQPTTPRHAPHPTFPQVFMDDDHYYGGRQLRQRHFLNAAEGSFNVAKERTEQQRGIMETELTNLVSKR